MFSSLTHRVRSNHSVDAAAPPSRPFPPPTTMQKLRGIAFGARAHEPSNPDYLAQKHKLDHLAAFLHAALQVLSDTLTAWAAIAKQQSHFAALVEAAGLPGSARSRCARAARNTARAAAHLQPDVLASPVVPNALEQLRRFLGHVTALQERYRDVRKMKKEYEVAAQRLKSAQGKLGGGGDALTRARARHERGREMYDAMVKRMAERMAEANRRMPDVVRTVHYLYWLMQDKAAERLLDATEGEMKHANAAEPALCYVTFCHGLRSPSSMFQTLDTRPEPRRDMRI